VEKLENKNYNKTLIKYLKQNVSTMKQSISYLLTWRKLMIHCGGRFCIIISFSLVSTCK